MSLKFFALLVLTTLSYPKLYSQGLPLTWSENMKWVNDSLHQVMKPNTYEASNGMDIPYRLYTPKADSEKLPLLIHLHGRGERGTDNQSKIYDNIPLFNSERSIVSPAMQANYPCYVLVPQCSDKTVNEEWAKWVGNTPETPFEGLGKDGSYKMNPTPSESGAATLELIVHAINSLNVDPDRVYITGLSMGGFGTWEFISRRPELFAAAVPMAGFSDPSQIDQFKHLPIWIFHGSADSANPPQGSRNMYQLLKSSGAEVKYTEYEGVEHSPAFQLAWKEQELIPWIFSKRRQ